MKTASLHKNVVKKHIQHVRFRFSQRKKTKKNMYMLLMVVAVVLIRRGIRGLSDMYLFPNHPVWSMIVSLIVGLIIFYLDDRELEDLVG